MLPEHYPYISQWANPSFNQQILAGGDPCADPDWHRLSGFTDAGEYRFWSKRICGIACFQSLLLYRLKQGWNGDSGMASRFAIWRRAMAANAYILQPDGSVKGLIYAPFVDMVGCVYGIKARVDTLISRDSLADCLARRMPVMISVTPKIRHAADLNPDSGRPGGHLVLCYALDDERVWFNNPSGAETMPYHSSLPLDVFFSYSAGRGVVFDAPSLAPARG
jgi:hypothetical protein